METIKKYKKPCITTVSIDRIGILCSSESNTHRRYQCSEFCKFWHLCRDRAKGKYCSDKEY